MGIHEGEQAQFAQGIAAIAGQHMGEIMQAVTKLSNELKSDSKIAAFPENLH